MKSLIIIMVFAGILTILSLGYVQYRECNIFCGDLPCPAFTEACGLPQPRAGFPLAFIYDVPGGSPISGWGNLGPEDFTSIKVLNVLGNVLFYGAGFWLGRQIVTVVRERGENKQRLYTLPIPVLVIAGVAGLAMIEQLPRTVEWVPRTWVEGAWVLVEPPENEQVVLEFQPNGDIHGDIFGVEGHIEYMWVNTNTFELSISSMEPGFCKRTLSFLKNACQSTRSLASAYPGPEERGLPVSSYPYPPAITPTPAPTLIPPPVSADGFIESSFTRVPFTVVVQNDLMTLTSVTDGTVVVFRRWTE